MRAPQMGYKGELCRIRERLPRKDRRWGSAACARACLSTADATRAHTLARLMCAHVRPTHTATQRLQGWRNRGGSPGKTRRARRDNSICAISKLRARGPHPQAPMRSPQAPTRSPTRAPQAPPRVLPQSRAAARRRAPAPVRRARTWPPPMQSARPRPVAAARGGQWPGRRRPALAQARAQTLAATQRARWSWQLAQARARTWPLPPPPPTPGPRPKAAARGARWP